MEAYSVALRSTFKPLLKLYELSILIETHNARIKPPRAQYRNHRVKMIIYMIQGRLTLAFIYERAFHRMFLTASINDY